MLLLNRLFSNDIRIWIFSLLIIGFSIFIQMFYKRSKTLKVWRLSVLLPPVVGLVHFLLFSFKDDFYKTIYFFGLFYLSAIICELPLLFTLPVLIKRFSKIKTIIFPISQTEIQKHDRNILMNLQHVKMME